MVLPEYGTCVESNRAGFTLREVVCQAASRVLTRLESAPSEVGSGWMQGVNVPLGNVRHHRLSDLA